MLHLLPISTLFPYTTLFRSIVIGPRSGLFSPLRTIGVIVLDEAHDNAYKNESAPHYQAGRVRSEEHTSELQSQFHLVCRLLLEKKKNKNVYTSISTMNKM